jgi:hypothetical protein
MKTSTGGKILVALAVASMFGGLSMGTALGDDNDWRRGQQNRGWHERDRHDNRGWRDNDGWRDNRGGWHPYRPVYAPPPVVYSPPPSPGISIFFPLFR